MMKKLSLLLIFVLIISFAVSPISGAAYTPTNVNVKSKVVMLVSLDTGNVVYSTSNLDKRMYPASLTKIMTAVVVLENCDDLDKKVTVPEKCITMLNGTGTALAPLTAGESISVRTLLHMLLISSAADAATTLANYFGKGNINVFVDKMNAKAAELDMKNTHFANPHGLHDDNHYTTANDMYKLASYAIKQPLITEICAKTRYSVEATDKAAERLLVTTNYLLDPIWSYYYEYATGLKTGFTDKAGRCLISTASQDGYSYMCIVLGGDDDSRSDMKDTKALYEWAFKHLEYRKVAEVTDIISELPINYAKERDYVQLYPEKNVSAIVPSDIDNSTLTYDVVPTEPSVNAPIEKGTVLGYVRIYCMNSEIAKVNLVAGQTLERNYLMYVMKIADNVKNNKYFQILCIALILLGALLVITNIIHNKRKRENKKRVKTIRKF